MRPTRGPSLRDMAERVNVDVVVVGAGLAGLGAARAVLAAGKTVVVLEARDGSAGASTARP